MDHLFTYGPVPVDEAERVPLKETEIGPVPEHWKVLTLGEIAEFKNGINFKKEQKGSGTPTVDVLNMYGDSIYLSLQNCYRVNTELRPDYLELPSIGWQLFVLGSSQGDSVAFSSLIDTYATRLLTEPLTQ